MLLAEKKKDFINKSTPSVLQNKGEVVKNTRAPNKLFYKNYFDGLKHLSCGFPFTFMSLDSIFSIMKQQNSLYQGRNP
jgi:hypothetical protein